MNKKKLSFSIFIAIIIISSLSIIISNRKEEKYSATYYSLGTVNEITLYDISKSKCDKILKNCESLLNDVHNKMSRQVKSSEISKINDNAGIDYVKVSDETYNIIKESIKFSSMSNGNFDVSTGPIIDLWGIGTDNAKVPTQSEITENLYLVNYNDILFNDKTHSIKLANKNMKIDLGGIAKGYAADKIYRYLNEDENLSSALINLGGNIYVLGSKINNQPFSIGIQDPTMPRGNSIGNIKVTDKSIVTSGIYERYIEENNKIYHHMIDPHTGYPFENNLSSVTIVSDTSMVGDALSTTVFSLGLKDGLNLIENLDGVDAIFITKDKEICLSNNIKDKFNLTDESFTIIN